EERVRLRAPEGHGAPALAGLDTPEQRSTATRLDELEQLVFVVRLRAVELSQVASDRALRRAKRRRDLVEREPKRRALEEGPKLLDLAMLREAPGGPPQFRRSRAMAPRRDGSHEGAPSVLSP